MRLLIVAYYFPPAGGGGVQRVLKLAKFLPQFGVEVHVLTPEDPRWEDADPGLVVPEGTVVHRSRFRGAGFTRPKKLLADAHGLRRLWLRLRLQPRRFRLPDPCVGWTREAIALGERVVRDEHIDAVLTTSPPASNHLIGRALQQRTGIPWITDLRDSWLNEPGLRLDSAFVRAKMRVNARIQDRTVGNADRILTVSQPIVDELAARYPSIAAEQRIHLLMNGVDTDDFEHVPDPAPNDRLTLVYTGNFFGPRSPRPLLGAIRTLAARRHDLANKLCVRFVGTLKDADAAWVRSESGFQGIVEIEPFRPYHETLATQRAADMLYLAIADGDRNAGEVTGKLFEYIAARRPILAVIPPHGAAASVLTHLGAHATVIAPSDDEGIVAALDTTIANWQSHGRAPDLEWTDEIDALVSRRARAAQLAGILDGLMTRPDAR